MQKYKLSSTPTLICRNKTLANLEEGVWTLESIGSFIWYIVSAAFHQKHRKQSLKEILQNHLKEAMYRKEVFKVATKIFCTNRGVMSFSFVCK